MNPIPAKLNTGTIGELLVQLRLLQYDVQAAPPIKDSGNDLIAVRRETFKAIQVKTTAKDGELQIPKDRLYHILAFVRLNYEGDRLLLDSSNVYLFTKESIDNKEVDLKNIDGYRISQGLVDHLFPPQ